MSAVCGHFRFYREGRCNRPVGHPGDHAETSGDPVPVTVTWERDDVEADPWYVLGGLHWVLTNGRGGDAEVLARARAVLAGCWAAIADEVDAPDEANRRRQWVDELVRRIEEAPR